MGHYRHNGMVHMELHTHDLPEVRAFLWQLLGWRSWSVGEVGQDYLALDVSDRLGGGIVGCGQRPPSWLPYVEVGDVLRSTERAGRLGARSADPREGPQGWRSVVSTPAAGDLAFWQPKPRPPRRRA